MQTYLTDAEGNGATLALNSRVTEGDATSKYCKASKGLDTPLSMPKGMLPAGSRKRLQVTDTVSGQISEVEARCVVNAAGLYAQDVALCLRVPRENVPKRYLAKGNYFTLAGKGTTLS